MSYQRSAGSKLGGLAGTIITLAFFLPWIRACNRELTGYDLATNNAGPITVEDSWVYWLALAAGIICVLMFLLLPTRNSSGRITTGTIRLIVGLVGFFPVLNVWYNVQQRGETIEILYGGWLIALGYAGVFLSFLLDLIAGEKSTTQEVDDWESNNPKSDTAF
jgi:hypothetical protein